jgi:hypothetical protein
MPIQAMLPHASNKKPVTISAAPVRTKPRSPSQASQRRASWLYSKPPTPYSIMTEPDATTLSP